MTDCNYLMPQHGHGFRDRDDFPLQCLLKEGHSGDHLCRLQQPEDERYFLWAPDYLNGCDCDPEDGCDCFVWNFITNEEAEKLLAR